MKLDLLVPTVLTVCILIVSIMSAVRFHRHPSSEEGAWLGFFIPAMAIIEERILRKAMAVRSRSTSGDTMIPLSSGWLIYTTSLSLALFSGFPCLMPGPEINALVMNMKTGQSRRNNSWLLSRLLRDLEEDADAQIGGLSITIIDAVSGAGRASLLGGPKLDPTTFAIQILIALDSWFYTRNSSVLNLTVLGLSLVGLIGNLPAWSVQKYTARHDAGKCATYALMRGKGHRHVFIIRNVDAHALNLEDLAEGPVIEYDWFKKGEAWIVAFVTFGFLVFTILVFTLYEDAKYLIFIMSLGTLSTMLSAWLPRSPQDHGIPLVLRDTISHPNSCITALQDLEQKHKGMGQTLAEIFLLPASTAPQ